MKHTTKPMSLSGRRLPSLSARSLLLTALVATAPFVTAQEAKVKVRVKADLEMKPDEGIGTVRMVKGDAGSVVALKTKGGRTVLGGVMQPELDWSLVAYDREKMTLIKSDKPKIVWGEGPVALETITHFGGQFRLIATKPDREKAKLLVLQQVLSPRSLTGKAAQLVYELPFDRLGKGPEYYVDNMAIGFTTTTSVDSTKLLVGLSPASTTRSAGAPIWAMVLDKQMKPLWNNTLTTDLTARSAQVIDVRVDKSGAAWYLVKNITDPAPKTKEVLGYHFELYRLDSAGQTSAKLDLPGKNFAQDARFELRADGTIICGGIYSDPDPNRNESLGMFRTKLDLVNMKWVEFIAYPYAKQLVKKQERLQNDMRMVRMIDRKDGGLFLISEKAGTETTMVSDLSGKKVAKTQWVNGTLHIMQVSKAGAEPVWYKQIERSLAYDDGGPGQVIAATVSDMLFVLYNDTDKNIENRKAKLPIEQVTSPKDLIMLEFKGDGTDKARAVLKETFKQGYLCTDRIWYMGPELVGTVGALSFNKEKSFPMLVELMPETKK